MHFQFSLNPQVLASEGCERYLFYARRVRNFGFRPRQHVLSGDEYAMIVSSFKGQEKYLLPNLLTLYLDTMGTCEFDVVPYLAPISTKVGISLSFENDLEDTPDLVEHLSQYGQLASVLVRIPSPGYVRTSLFQVLTHSPNLTFLELVELKAHNSYIVDAIGIAKPRLEVLICHVYDAPLLDRMLCTVRESLVQLDALDAGESEDPNLMICPPIELGFPELRRCIIKLDGAGAPLWEAITYGPLPALRCLSLTLGADNRIPESVSITLRPQLTHLSVSPYTSRYIVRTRRNN